MQDKVGYSREDWQQHYDDDDLKWDLEEVSPPFVNLWQEGKIPQGKMIVPGCGRGHEVLFFSERGFDVTAVDFTLGAVDRLTESLNKKNLSAKIFHHNFFELSAKHDLKYDLMLEQTFFCAIDPEKRIDYVETAWRVLKSHGKLIALFYETGEEGGPPFNTTKGQVEEMFSKRFDVEYLEKTQFSAERRRDKEWLGILRKI